MKENLKKTISISMFLALTYSCSQITKSKNQVNEVFGTKDYADAIVSRVVPKWFTGNDKFNLKQNYGGRTRHMFYDVTPDIDLDKYTLNFVVTTPENSKYSYDIDLDSGQHHFGKLYCKQSDIWGKYGEVIYKPPYTAGIVPRILDQIGAPQKIIVFGGEDYYQKNFTQNYFDARIVGGFIEQVCPTGGCLKKGEWNSRIVLVGVQKDHSKYNKIKSLIDLKKHIDWPRVKAFVENGQGRNIIVENYYPAYRYGAEINKDQALRYLDKNSIYLKNKKLISIRKTCHRLYNVIWNKIGLNSSYEKNILKLQTNKEREKFLGENKITKQSLFYTRFKTNFKKYESEYKTCIKYVYPSNINQSPKRHWFFSYYSAVHLLHELGYSFDCTGQRWIESKRLNTLLKSEFRTCTAKQIDLAFAKSIYFLDMLRKKDYPSYRYVSYDGGSLGTHNKVYSWVKDDNKVLACESDKKEEILKSMVTFPKDIKWNKRRLKINRKGLLIK